MKKHLLPFLFIALCFSACTPDEDVDMPMPDNSVEEQIQGLWLNYEFSDINYLDYAATDTLYTYHYPVFTPLSQAFKFDEHMVYFGSDPFSNIEPNNGPDVFPIGNSSPYYILKRDGKTYINYDNTKNYDGEATKELSGDWEISSITDSTMTWIQELKNTSYIAGGDDQNIPLTVYTLKFRRTQP